MPTHWKMFLLLGMGILPSWTPAGGGSPQNLFQDPNALLERFQANPRDPAITQLLNDLRIGTIGVFDPTVAAWSKHFVHQEGGFDDVNYVLNHTEAVLTVFRPWFESESVAYKEMMRDYHRVACLGTAGNRPYRAFRCYWSSEAQPGELKPHEPAYFDEASIYLVEARTLSRRLRLHPARDLALRLVELLDRYHRQLVWDPPYWQINHSVAMGQINYILVSSHLSGIPHSFLNHEMLQKGACHALLRQVLAENLHFGALPK